MFIGKEHVSSVLTDQQVTFSYGSDYGLCILGIMYIGNCLEKSDRITYKHIG